jgi:head-tail adaptor
MINAKSLSLADLRRRVKFYAAANSKDKAGNIKEKPYTERCEVWGALQAQNPRVIASTDEAVHEILTTIIIRYRDDILQTDKIIVGSRNFIQVGPPVNVEERNHWLVLTCKEVVPYA